MNAGGPAYQVSLLGGLLDPTRFETLLVTGNLGPGEGSLVDLADELGVTRRHVGSLGPELDGPADLRALAELVRIVRDFRPDVVHTHTAKAGMLGRLAALSARPRPVIVHTYHGHVLEGYFGPLASGIFRALERLLGLVSDRLIGVSEATVADLVRLRVAGRDKFEVVPLGLRLDPFLSIGAETGTAIRAELGIDPDRVLLTAVGRLVPIKRLDVLITAMAELRSRGNTPMLAIVGDGQLRTNLEELGRELGVADVVRFLGYRRDLVEIVAATDIAVLTSDNEGTPVALIEAAAGGRPLVATDVGGVSDVVVPGAGRLVAPGDAVGLADAIEELAASETLRRRLGAFARDHVRQRYQAERLVDDIERLYERLTFDRDGVGPATPAAGISRVEAMSGSRWSVITRLMGSPGQSVLDVGCRDRALLGHLAPGTEYVGVDLGPPADVIASAEEPLPFADDSFDCVVLADVLEHLDDPHAALDEAMRIGRRSVVILLPNLYTLWLRALYVSGRTTAKYSFGPQNSVDRHRWVMNFDQAAAFTRGRAEAGGWRVAREVGIDAEFRRRSARAAYRLARVVGTPNLWAWEYAARLEPAQTVDPAAT